MPDLRLGDIVFQSVEPVPYNGQCRRLIARPVRHTDGSIVGNSCECDGGMVVVHPFRDTTTGDIYLRGVVCDCVIAIAVNACAPMTLQLSPTPCEGSATYVTGPVNVLGPDVGYTRSDVVQFSFPSNVACPSPRLFDRALILQCGDVIETENPNISIELADCDPCRADVYGFYCPPTGCCSNVTQTAALQLWARFRFYLHCTAINFTAPFACPPEHLVPWVQGTVPFGGVAVQNPDITSAKWLSESVPLAVYPQPSPPGATCTLTGQTQIIIGIVGANYTCPPHLTPMGILTFTLGVTVGAACGWIQSHPGLNCGGGGQSQFGQSFSKAIGPVRSLASAWARIPHAIHGTYAIQSGTSTATVIIGEV